MNTNKQINVFIVDDNKIFSLALKGYIENAFNNMPIKIFLFSTGEKCMASFAQVIPELIILDYNLNSKLSYAENGVQFLQKIKKSHPSISVIMLTSNDHIDTALESFHHGASDYVVKTDNPFRKLNNSMSKIFTEKEIEFESIKNKKRALEIIMFNKELGFQMVEKEKRAAELIISNQELTLQIEERKKIAAEFISMNNQKVEAEKYRHIVEEKNKNITDSIKYAKRIQKAILPKMENIYTSLPKSFVLFKPKDIVSGDFYFFHKNSHSVFIVAADCTGHGVPGALMSMIGSEKLTEAVSQSTDTSEILKYLNKGIKNSLHQSDSIESTRDGMDIGICSVDTESDIVRFAGANRPLWVIRKDQKCVEEIKGTKRAIGGLTDHDQHFDTHELKLMKGDTFYISTDGYADQFGGIMGKKVMTKRFKEILLSIQDMPMEDQKIYLEKFIEGWRGEADQVDDILVVGVRL